MPDSGRTSERLTSRTRGPRREAVRTRSTRRESLPSPWPRAHSTDESGGHCDYSEPEVKRGRRTRSAAEVAARARALAALVLRANGEGLPDADWTPEERELLARHDEQDVVDATWRGEALAVLLWA